MLQTLLRRMLASSTGHTESGGWVATVGGACVPSEAALGGRGPAHTPLCLSRLGAHCAPVGVVGWEGVRLEHSVGGGGVALALGEVGIGARGHGSRVELWG